MATDCLEKMVAALDRHPDCGLAHCPLVHIDEHSDPFPNQWWPSNTIFGRSSGELVNQPHVRRAPYDGLLPLTGEHAYFSFTQLLIRRTLFDRVGPLESRWGSYGDFNWYMRAGLVSNTVHVPNTWASLRLHTQCATFAVPFGSPEFHEKIEAMIQDAVQGCEAYLDPLVAEGLRAHWMEWTREMRSYYAALRYRPSAWSRRTYQFAQLFTGTKAVRLKIFGRLVRKPKWADVAPSELRQWLESMGRGAVIVPTQPKV